MIDLNEEALWQSIKHDVMTHIPTIHSGEGYGSWFTTVALMKDAGYTQEEVGLWCAEDGEPNNSTWNGIKDTCDDVGKARGALVKKAQEHGFTFHLSKQDRLFNNAKHWLYTKSDDKDFCIDYIRKMRAYQSQKNLEHMTEEQEQKIGDEFLIKQYLSSSEAHENKLQEIKDKVFSKKINKNGKEELVLNNSAIDELIDWLGFRQVNNGDDLDYIRITNKYFIEKMTAKKVKSLIHEELEKMFTPVQYNVIKNSGIIEKERTLNTISIINPAVHDDTSASTYFYFQNGVVEVLKDKYLVHDYNIINGYLWKDAYKSIKHTFSYRDDAGDFEKFCKNIVSNDADRFRVLQSILGYYMSRYRRASMCKCVVLTDRIEEDDAARGGTGKSTLVEALKEVRSIGTINGKNKNQDQRFIFSGYQVGNTVYAIDDITENFDTEAIFKFITGNTTVERKYENAIEVYLKHIITSNYVPRNIVADESHKRRFNVFELDHYYTSTFTPMDEFKKEFFSADWCDEDWNQFYSFLIRCEQVFLQEGLKSFTTETSDLIKLKKSINNVALEFIEDELINKHDLEGEIIYTKDLKDEYENYIKDHHKKFGVTSYKLTGELAKFFGAGYSKDKDRRGMYIKIDKAQSPFFQDEEVDVNTLSTSHARVIEDPFEEDEESTVQEVQKVMETDNDPFLSDAPDADGVKTIYVPEGVTPGRNVKGTYSVFTHGTLIECDENGKSLNDKYKLVWGDK